MLYVPYMYVYACASLPTVLQNFMYGYNYYIEWCMGHSLYSDVAEVRGNGVVQCFFGREGS